MILLFLALSLVNHFVFLDGFSSLKINLLTAIMAFCIMIPLFSAKMLGGGDVKLITVFALNVPMYMLIYTFIYSMIWGLFLGLAMVVLKKNTKTFIENTIGILRFQKPNSSKLNTIPYSVALFFGWLTALSPVGSRLF